MTSTRTTFAQALVNAESIARCTGASSASHTELDADGGIIITATWFRETGLSVYSDGALLTILVGVNDLEEDDITDRDAVEAFHSKLVQEIHTRGLIDFDDPSSPAEPTYDPRY